MMFLLCLSCWPVLYAFGGSRKWRATTLSSFVLVSLSFVGALFVRLVLAFLVCVLGACLVPFWCLPCEKRRPKLLTLASTVARGALLKIGSKFGPFSDNWWHQIQNHVHRSPRNCNICEPNVSQRASEIAQIGVHRSPRNCSQNRVHVWAPFRTTGGTKS